MTSPDIGLLDKKLSQDQLSQIVIDQKLSKLESKIDLILQQQQSTQKAIAHFRGEVNRK